MPRTARIVNPGWPHHVILRGNNRRRLCSYATDYRSLVSLIGRAAIERRCLVHALCILANHLHLLVTPAVSAALAAFVRAFAQPFAQRRNRSRDGSGKLFEQRYFSECVETDEQLAVCTAYIELNPVRAGVVHDPGDYLWSTYRLHARDPRPSAIPGRLLTPSPWYTGLGHDPETRAEAYRTFVRLTHREGRKPANVPVDVVPSTRRLERPDRTRAL